MALTYSIVDVPDSKNHRCIGRREESESREMALVKV